MTGNSSSFTLIASVKSDTVHTLVSSGFRLRFIGIRLWVLLAAGVNPGAVNRGKMGNIAVINTAALTDQARKPVFGGPCALDRAAAWAQGIPECEGLVFLISEEAPNLPASGRAVRTVYRDRWNEAELIAALRDAALAFDECEIRHNVLRLGRLPPSG